ncbi:5-oxoprolinase subunit C family protein [Diaphorobacter caeni]|uniref:5-oxoprolinase subunit C family protein n=1 Tax=Diaphorobacter caeni TaxID=2784387 RepID=UPI001890A2D3|nr:biotin-dependent carboxyltransferase family protein [Diaphorobacter caeni]MBF5006910.1 biotin-dependent carboxyltransferase family protein [Diaphorobacter caeni]
MIDILSSGALNQVQDLGRKGHMQQGISRGGAMDAPALAAANLLVDNPPTAAGLEIGMFPFRVRFRQTTRFACTGAHCVVRIDDRVLPPWWSAVAQPGQTLTIEPPLLGLRSYLAIAGGIDVPVLLGSASTDNKGSFGGFEGRGLRRGDALPVAAAASSVMQPREFGCVPARVAAFWQQLREGRVTLQAIAGAEYPLFTEQAQAAFCDQDWIVTREANRTGFRLDSASGERLELRHPVELLSHGILPGTVQVPPSGNPIVQMAEANTCGGYPKIATVNSADLWQLAQTPAGVSVRFSLTTLDKAIAEAQALQQWLVKLQADLSLLRR